MPQKEIKKRKRQKPPQLDDDKDEGAPMTKKENTNSVISEVEFKFLLSDQKTVSEGLEKFIQSAEATTAGLPCPDIVAGYCRSSQTCSELFALIDPVKTQLKMNEIAPVFQCLELILNRIRTDLFKFSSTGEAIVQKILAGHMGQVYNCLQEQHKSKTIKACLQLLIAMVSVSERAKKAVQSRLNFTHVNFPPLFRRRNRKDPKDVRSCAVLLTLAFLLDSDLSTISTLVQQKSFIQQTMAGLKYDRQELVLDVLATFLDKVVTFPGLSKTDKVKLFSEAVLKQLCELYDWQGPSGWVPAKKKRQKKEQARVTPEGFSEDQETVANVGHEFLMELCCSHKNGLNFYDKTVGTGQRNHNQLLGHVVDWLVKKIDERRKAELVVGILCACPDLIKATLTNLCPSLAPRWSDKWRELMTWVTNLYRKLPDTPPFLANQENLKDNHVTVISMAAVFCLPPPGVAAVIVQSLRHEDIRVRDKGARLLQVLAKKACAIHSNIVRDVAATRVVPSANDHSFMDAFCACVMKTLPPTNLLFVCVDKTMEMMSAKKKKLSDLETPLGDEKSSVDLSRHASLLLQVLGLYQTLIPSLLSERPKDLAKLIDMVGCLQSHHKSEAEEGDESVDNKEEIMEKDIDTEIHEETPGDVHVWLPQLYLLKLLSDTDARKISLGREGLMEKLLLSASENDKFKHLTIGLVCKMLQSMEIFTEHVKELQTWLEIAMNSTDKGTSTSSSQTVTFLARCLATLINNPSPYVDRTMETSRLDVDEDKKVHSASTGTSDSAIDAILLMDTKDLDSKLDECHPQLSSKQSDLLHLPFSPLTVVALDHLQHGKTVDDTETEYVSRVLVRLLHSLPNPVVLARIVMNSETMLCGGVAAYLQYWTGRKSRSSVTQPLPAHMIGTLTSSLMCQHFGLKNSHCTLVELLGQVHGMTSQEKLTGLKQILLYVADTLQLSVQKIGCEETIRSYLHLATSLFDHICEEEGPKPSSEDSRWLKVFLNTSKIGANDENGSEDEVGVFDVLFSRIVSSASESVVADGVKCVLLNPVVKSWLFNTACNIPHISDKKSPKRKDKFTRAVSISESVSEFVSYVITKSRSCSWLASERELVEEYVSVLLNVLINRKLSPKLEEICCNTLESVSPILGLASLSRCVVRLLDIPLASLVGRCQDDAHVNGVITQTCKTLCELFKHFKVVIESDSSFISNAQLTKLYCPRNAELYARSRNCVHNLDGCASKGCIQIKTTFDFEDSTGQKVAAFALVFELLPLCENEHLREFAIFALTWLPEMASLFAPKLFDELFKSPLALLKDSQDDRLFVSMVKNVKGCFLLYEDWLTKHINTVINQGKWFLIFTYLEANLNFSGGYTKTVEAIKQKASINLQKLNASSFSQSLPCLKLLSLAVQKNDPAFQTLLTESVVDHIRERMECHLLHFTVLEISAGFCMQNSNNGQAGVNQSAQSLVLDLAVDHFTYLITTGPAESVPLEKYILEMALNLIPKLAHSEWSSLFPCWQHLVKSALRHRLTDARLLQLVADLAEKVLCQGTDTQVTQSLFGQCVDHSMFNTIMTAAEYSLAKVELVKLLHILGEMDPSCYSRAQLDAVLASAYTASLSLTDQRLLVMMEKCSHSHGIQFECPTLWGKSVLEHQSVSEVLGPSLHKQASTQVILEQFNSQLMQHSILNFPVRRFHSGNAIADASEFKSKPDCYDPAFLLRLFVQILSPDKQVPLSLFVDRDCLSYLLIALSSHDSHNRLLAYRALNDFYLHADGSRWHDKIEMTFVLDLLNASRVKDGQKLPYVVALFFARTVKLLIHPADPMYVPIFRFLVAKPEVDLGGVPEFYQLFFSSGIQYKHERNWMLSLLCNGMREMSDYWLYQQKFIFKIVFSYYDSAISDAGSQELVLLMVRNACKEKSVAVDLVKNHGLMPWLAAATAALENRPEQTDLLCDIIHTLWFSLTATKYLAQSQSSDRKPQTSAGVVSLNNEVRKNVDGESEEIMDTGNNHLNNTARNGTASSSQQKIATDDEMSADEENLSGSGTDYKREDIQVLSCQVVSQSTTSLPVKTSVPTVPRSTVVEMSLLTKSIIWHLSNSSVDGLLKVLQVLHEMTSSKAGSIQMPHSASSIDSRHAAPHKPELSSQFQNILNLSPIESCLLLFHVATAVEQPATAGVAASVLKSKGVDFEQSLKKPNRKSTSRGNTSAVKGKNCDQILVDMTDLEENIQKKQTKSKQHSDDGEVPKLMEDTPKRLTVSKDEKQHLFQLFHDIVRSSRTLEFV